MDRSQQKVVQYLNEAHGTEVALIRVLQEQVAVTPRGSYRTGLEKHLRETRDHARRVEARLGELGEGRNPVQAVNFAAQSVIGQALALAKSPIDLLRGTGGEEKVLKNAKDAASTEALEIATYTAIERLASAVGDDKTAKLAASIRADEERMLERVMAEIPKLTEAVVGADVEGDPSYDVTKTGAADSTRAAGRSAARNTRSAGRSAAGGARKAASSAKRTSRQARKVPGVARAEGEAKGAVASASDLPIARYDELNASEITSRLSELSQIDLAKVDAYERKNDNRSTVLERISTLRGNEPWPGYDEQTVSDIESALSAAGEDRVKAVREYERAHKNRSSV